MANKLTHLSLPLCARDVAPAPAARRLVTRQSAGTKPNVTIRLQPSVGDRVVYLALGPTKEGGTRQWKLVVGGRITNNEPQDIALTGVRFTFPSSQVPAAVMYHPDLVTAPIPPGQSAWWSSGFVGIPNTKESKYNAGYHDLPAPAGVRIHLQFAGYTQEIAITAPLVRHEAPVAGKGYRFPFLGARSGAGRVVHDLRAALGRRWGEWYADLRPRHQRGWCPCRREFLSSGRKRP